MDWFFTSEEAQPGSTLVITGEDASHITKSLRMSVGEVITMCAPGGAEMLCKIGRITSEGVFVQVVTKEQCCHEPSVGVTLYFALTKGDKPETVIQKSVELGAVRIVPVLTRRCVSRPDGKSMEKKLARYRKIALQAAMQSRRGIIPEIRELTELKDAAAELTGYDKAIVFYEGGGKPLREILSGSEESVAVFIGPEGGFDEEEIGLLTGSGALCATLGKRILRAETAPLAALTAIMFHTGNLE